MRRHLGKRFGTGLLALVLALSLLPAGALAEETEGAVAEESSRETETLAEETPETPATPEEVPEVEEPSAPEEDRDGQTEPPASTPSTVPVSPNSPAEFTLTAGQEQYLSLTVKQSGFYTLSHTISVSDADCRLEVWNTDWENWQGLSEPIYVEAGIEQLAKFVLSWVPEQSQDPEQEQPSEPTPVTVSVSLQAFHFQELTLGKETAVTFENNAAYFSFTPPEDGTYLIKTSFGDASASGWLYVWNTETRDWGGSPEFFGEETRALAGSGNARRYLKLNINGGSSSETGAKITVSRFTEEVTSPSASAGAAKITDGFRASIPLTVKAPLGMDFHVGIEYKEDKIGSTITGRSSRWFNQNDVLIRWESLDIDTLPKTDYQYRAYVEFRNGETRKTVTEETWHSFRSGDAEFTALQTKESETFQGEGHFLFTPVKEGRYILSVTNCFNLRVWNRERLAWGYYAIEELQRHPFLLSAGDSLYIWADSNYSDIPDERGTITVSEFQSTVSEYSIEAAPPTDFQDSSAWLPVTGEVPFGSSFCICAEFNYTALDNSLFSGGGFIEGGRVSNSESEYLDQGIGLEVLPNMSYQCWVFLCGLDQYGQADKNNRLTDAVPVDFTTESLSSTPLELGAPETFRPENGRGKVLCFTPEEDGYYQIELSGSGEGELSPWSTGLNAWDYENGVTIGRQSSLNFSGFTGVPQYFLLALYEPAGGTAALTLTLSEFTPTVTSFSITTGEASTKTDAPGFSALVPAEVSAPMDRSFEVRLEVLRNGEYRHADSRWINRNGQEVQTVELILDTLPGQTYQYRVCLTAEDAAGSTGSTGETIYGQARSYTAPSFSPNTAVKLVLDKPVSGGGATGTQKESIFYFVPDADGPYQVTLDGGATLQRGVEGFWVRPDAAGSSNVFNMKKGKTEFFRLLGRASDGQCTITVSRFQSQVTDFSITSEAPQVDGLEVSIPVQARVPIGSNFVYGVRYGLDTNMVDRVSNSVRGSTTETLSYSFVFPVLPGKTYTYRVFLIDQTGYKEYLGPVQSFSTPAAESMTNLIQLETEPPTGTVSTGPKNCYTFCPKMGGTYCLCSDGQNGAVTVLYEDGSWEELYYGYEDAPPMTLRLAANTTIYLIHTEHRSNRASLWAEHQSLAAEYRGGTVTVTLDADAPGQYIFAVYDASHKLLSLSVKAKKSTGYETLTASLTGVSGNTAFVKVFTLDDEHHPAAPVQEITVPRT